MQYFCIIPILNQVFEIFEYLFQILLKYIIPEYGKHTDSNYWGAIHYRWHQRKWKTISKTMVKGTAKAKVVDRHELQKYRGKSWSDPRVNFLEWILSTSVFCRFYSLTHILDIDVRKKMAFITFVFLLIIYSREPWHGTVLGGRSPGCSRCLLMNWSWRP